MPVANPPAALVATLVCADVVDALPPFLRASVDKVRARKKKKMSEFGWLVVEEVEKDEQEAWRVWLGAFDWEGVSEGVEAFLREVFRVTSASVCPHLGTQMRGGARENEVVVERARASLAALVEAFR